MAVVVQVEQVVVDGISEIAVHPLLGPRQQVCACERKDILHEEDIDPDLRVKTTRIGAASIGNWSIPTKPDSEFAIRNLNGSIDEFAIFAATLSADEIREMYDNGKP